MPGQPPQPRRLPPQPQPPQPPQDPFSGPRLPQPAPPWSMPHRSPPRSIPQPPEPENPFAGPPNLPPPAEIQQLPPMPASPPGALERVQQMLPQGPTPPPAPPVPPPAMPDFGGQIASPPPVYNADDVAFGGLPRPPVTQMPLGGPARERRIPPTEIPNVAGGTRDFPQRFPTGGPSNTPTIQRPPPTPNLRQLNKQAGM